MHRRLILIGLVALLPGAALTAAYSLQAAQSSQSAGAPTFKSAVEYVEVDVVVTNSQGQFVRDLKKEDFQVSEDGKRQAVTDFTLVDIPIEKYDRPLYASQPIEPDVRTNERPFEGRVYVMVVDDLHTEALRLQRTKVAAQQFIQQRLGANDLMAVVHTAGADDASQEFTNNKRLLLAAVNKTSGRALESATAIRNQNAIATGGRNIDDTQDLERAMNAENTLRMVRDIATWFSTVHGRRKTILFVSEGIDYDMTNVMERSDQPGSRSSVVLAATREAIDAAMRSNVSIYGIDPRGLAGIDDIGIEYAGSNNPNLRQRGLQNEQSLMQDSLRMLSEETGGFAVVGRNDLVNAYDRIVADNSSYYVLAYYPPSDKRDGKFHKIDVKVNQPGLVTRARRGYMSPSGKAPAPRALDPRGPSAALLDALASPLPVSGLTMHVSLAPFKGTAPNASVLFTAEVRGRDLSLAPNDALELSFMAVDVKGKTRGGSDDTIAMTSLRPETRARVEESGLRVFNRLELPPGRYQMRIAGHDAAGGAVGSVAYDLEVPDFYKLPFSMSGLVMTSPSTSQMVVVRADAELLNVLPAPPVAERSFPRTDEIVLFAEVYDNAGSTPHKVDIGTTVTADDGRVVYKQNEEHSSTEIGGTRGGYGYTARVPLKDLAPGSYVITVEARSRLGRDVAASRQVQIDVTSGEKPGEKPREKQ
jgi:VWFA-related protein